MSVSINTAKVQYTLAATVQALPITFYFLDNSHIKAIRARAGVADYIMVLGTDYTLAGAGDEGGGTLTTIATNMQVGDIITIKRDVPFTQVTNYVYNDKFPAEVHERVADKLTMETQQLKEVTDRALQFPETEVAGTGNVLPEASGRAGKILGFDATGNQVQLFDPASVVFAQGDAIYANSIAALKAVVVTGFLNGQQAHVGGYAGPGDGGGGTFVYVSLSAATENTGTIVAPNAGTGRWFRVFSTRANVKWWGAKGDGATNDRAAIQSAIDYCASVGLTLFMPEGTYMVDMQALGLGGVYSLVAKSNLTLVGQGRDQTIIKLTNAAYGGGSYHRILITDPANYQTGITVRDLTIDGNSANQTASTNGGNLLFGPCNDVLIENIASLNANGQGIQLANALGSIGSNQTIRGCKVKNCSYIGIQCAQFLRLSILDNTVEDTVDNAIDVYGENGTVTAAARQFIISRNRIKNGSVGIFLETVRQGVVTDNIIDACTSIGITCNRINGAPEDLVVSDNLVIGAPMGLRITGDTNGVVVTSNSFKGFSTAGISLGGVAAGAGSVGYVLVAHNYLKPTATNVPIIISGGNQLAFALIVANFVNSNLHDTTKLFVRNATTHLGVQEMEFLGVADVNGKDLKRTDGSITTLLVTTLTATNAAITNLTALVNTRSVKMRGNSGDNDIFTLATDLVNNTAGPVAITVPDNTAGFAIINVNQNAFGTSTYQIPYIKKGGTLVIGTPVVVVSGADPVTGATVVANNISIALAAANSNLRWGISATPTP